MHSKKFTGRDLDVLQILWDATDSMTALEIVREDPSLTINTVQAVLRKLLKQGLIMVNRIVYSGTVLSRSFSPAISSEDFIILQIKEQIKEINNINKISLIAAFLREETDTQKVLKEIEELETMLSDYKKNLKENINE